MPNVAGVRFRGAGKLYHFDPGSLVLKRGDAVIVSTAQGEELAIVAEEPHFLAEVLVRQPLKPVLRTATDEDVIRYEENCRKEKAAFASARTRIEAHNLDMRLVDVECTFNRSKLLFYFTAEGRIDFRALVRDLAQEFRMRIELRQIGVRDEAKKVGGLGVCGRPLCCASWLTEFIPVSIKMAKEQNLSMNPGKISGCCGRLLCCLKYEYETYEKLRKTLPKQGATIVLPQGKAKVDQVQILEERAVCRLLDDPEQTVVVTAAEWQELKPARKERERGREAGRERPGCAGGSCGCGKDGSGGCCAAHESAQEPSARELALQEQWIEQHGSGEDGGEEV